MQNYNSKLKIIISFLFIFLISAGLNTVWAQTYKLELANPTAKIETGKNFQVKVLINTGGIQAINGDVLLVYDPTKLTVNSAQTGNFFTYFSGNKLGGVNNKYLVSSWEESISRPKSSTTDTLFASLDINAGGSGATTLSFECQTGSEADTNINQASDSKDIVKCSDLKTLSLNIGAASSGPTSTPSPTIKASPTSTPSATLTPKPTSTPVPTNTPRPTISQLPRAGTAEVTVAALGIGFLLTVMGVLIIL